MFFIGVDNEAVNQYYHLLCCFPCSRTFRLKVVSVGTFIIYFLIVAAPHVSGDLFHAYKIGKGAQVSTFVVVWKWHLVYFLI